MGEPLLQARGLGKRYSGTVALDQVDLDIGRGEVHALLGENGAGKSTLLKILSGDQRPSSGTITLKGHLHAPANPREAQRAGIVTVHQEFSLIPDLSIAENILLAREPGRAGLISWPRMRAEAAHFAAMVGLTRSPREIVRNLSVAEQQLVEIARALSIRADVLILDEPTATLTSTEVARLGEVVRNLARAGVAVVFVTHRLNEVFDLCQRYTVLRDGRRVAGGMVSDTDTDGLVSAMIGRSAVDVFPRRQSPQIGDIVLRLRGATCLPHAADTTAIAVHDVDLDLHAGEILGLAGLVGAGRTQLARCIFGADPFTRARVEFEGREVAFSSPTEAIAAGLAFVPEDRKAQGLFADLAVRTNFSVANMDAFELFPGLLSLRRERALFDTYHRKLRIRTADPAQPISALSGGNQQKVILARWIARNPKLLIVDEPTRGIDVGAKAEIYQLLYQLADKGVAILVISSELPELIAVSDRVMVMREGRITGTLEGPDITETATGALMLASASEHRMESTHV